MKKGQISIFIILAIILLIILFFLEIVNKNLTDSNFESQEVKNYVDYCLSSSLVNSLNFSI